MILAVQYRDKWGALGISRLEKLMYKELKCGDLSILMKEFIDSYVQYWHTVVEICIGLPFAHENITEIPLQWKVMQFSISTTKPTWEDYNDAFIQYSKECVTIANHFQATGKLPSWCTESYRSGKSMKRDR